MTGDRAYLINTGTRYRIQVSVTARTPRRTSGRHLRTRPVARHRLGTGPHLRHCGDLPAVGSRLTAMRQTTPVRPPHRRVPPGVVLLLLVASFTAVSGWFAATGAVAFAGMMH